MKTFVAKSEEITRHWFLVDATDKTLGRLASAIAIKLRGKGKPIFTPNTDCGDYIVVVNANKIKVTGNKLKDKMYYRNTGYIGNLKESNLEKMLDKDASKVIFLAVKGMIPRGPLGREVLKKLKVYNEDSHPHEGQQPQTINI